MRGYTRTVQSALLVSAFALAGCDEGRATAQPGAGHMHSPKVTKWAKSAAEVAVHPLSESDRTLLGVAASACRSQDKSGFFDAFIQSRAVQRKYTARTVELSVRGLGGERYRLRKIDGTEYPGAPIDMIDYYRKPAQPSRAGDLEEYVMISINQSQSNQISVEWTRVHFDGKSEGGDDLGNAFDLDGKPYDPGGRTDGQLLFAPTSDCWELVADTRYRRGAAE